MAEESQSLRTGSDLIEAIKRGLIQAGIQPSQIDDDLLEQVVQRNLQVANKGLLDLYNDKGGVTNAFLNAVLQEYSFQVENSPEADSGSDPFAGGPPGGGGGADKDAARKARRQTDFNQRAGFLSYLQGFQMNVTGNLTTLLDQAVRRNWSNQTFLYYLRQTPEYRQAFPGIFDSKGNLKYDEATYLQYKTSFSNIAAQAGINLGPQTLTMLFRKNETPETFQVKAEAVGQMRRNPQLLAQFQRVTGEDVGKKELLRFISGMGDARWYNQWQETVARNAAIEGGIRISRQSDKYEALGPGQVRRVAREGYSESDLRAGFQEVADLLLNTTPEALAQNYRLTKKQVVDSVFGGPGSARTRRKIQLINKNAAAFEDTRANPQVYAAEGGGVGVVGGSARAAQTD